MLRFMLTIHLNTWLSEHKRACRILSMMNHKPSPTPMVKRTPEFFLFNSNNELVYRGRMDDSPKDPSLVTSTDLKNAIDALINGVSITIQETESIGCSVKWKV